MQFYAGRQLVAYAGCSGRAQIAAADGASDVAIVVLALAPKQR